MIAGLIKAAILIALVVITVKVVYIIVNFIDMKYTGNYVQDLEFNIMRLFLEQQNILAELGIKVDLRLHNNKFFRSIKEVYDKMCNNYIYITPSVNTRIKESYIEQLKSNYEDNINSINMTIMVLNSYSCMHNYACDNIPVFLRDGETGYVENINPRRDHGIVGTEGGLI